MSYFLIGEMPVDDGSLFVLWTRSRSGVRVLPIGSRARRDMQALGRQLIDVAAPDGDPGETLKLVISGVTQHEDGQPLRLVDLDDPMRQSMARMIASELAVADRAAVDVIDPL